MGGQPGFSISKLSGETMKPYQHRNRFASFGLALVVQGAITAAVIFGLGTAISRQPPPPGGLPVITLTPEPPVPETPPAPPEKSVQPEGAAAPPAKMAKPKEIVAPEPEIRLQTENELVAAPAASDGMDTQSGAAPIDGPGNGGGGEGDGTGSGRSGDGSGGVPIVSRARYVSGEIRPRDYPRDASRAREQGSVVVNFDVRPDGRVGNCHIVKSSGSAELDRTTCALIEKRFRYEPARDASGRAVADVSGWEQRYWLD